MIRFTVCAGVLGCSLAWCAMAQAALFDKARTADDYAAMIWVDSKKYDKPVPGHDMTNFSKMLWHINCALFDTSGSLVKVLAFPTLLLVKNDQFDAAKPQLMQCMRESTAQRALLTIENGKLVKYNLSAQKDPNTKQVVASVDFGKRIPITFDGIDQTYQPRADEHGDIYFKTRGGAKKWSSTTQSIVEGSTLLDEPVPMCVREKNGMLSATDALVEYAILQTTVGDLIDPLSAHEPQLKATGAGYGSENNPVTKIDYQLLTDSGQLAVGKVLALKERLDTNKKIMLESTLTLTPEQCTAFERTINEFAKTYEQKKTVIAELRLQMRELDSASKIKKRFSKAEVAAILGALTPRTGGGVVLGVTPKERAVIQDDGVVVSLHYYRFLRAYVLRPSNADWQDFSQFKLVRSAVLAYPRAMLDDAKIKTLLKQVAELERIHDWVAWFRANTVIEYDLLFDYLITLDERTLDTVLNDRMFNLSHIRLLKELVTLYKINRP